MAKQAFESLAPDNSIFSWLVPWEFFNEIPLIRSYIWARKPRIALLLKY